MPYASEYLRALSTALNWALVLKPRRDPPGIRGAFWASADEYPCGSCPFRLFCPTVPNRVPLARSGPTPEQLVVAEAVLADTAQRLAPVRDTLAAAVAAVGRAQSDGISVAKAWRADAAWDIAKLTEIIAAYGPRGVSAEAAIAERLVCDGHLPAGALADAKRPAQPDQIVLQI